MRGPWNDLDSGASTGRAYQRVTIENMIPDGELHPVKELENEGGKLHRYAQLQCVIFTVSFVLFYECSYSPYAARIPPVEICSCPDLL